MQSATDIVAPFSIIIIQLTGKMKSTTWIGSEIQCLLFVAGLLCFCFLTINGS